MRTYYAEQILMYTHRDAGRGIKLRITAAVVVTVAVVVVVAGGGGRS